MMDKSVETEIKQQGAKAITLKNPTTNMEKRRVELGSDSRSMKILSSKSSTRHQALISDLLAYYHLPLKFMKES